MSEKDSLYHFAKIGKMVDIGSGAQRRHQDYKLSRYACYLIVQNENPKKQATTTHFKVGRVIRNAIAELNGTMPEELPTAKKSIKELEREENFKLQK